MQPAESDQIHIALFREGDNVLLQHPKWGSVPLGQFDDVCDELCRFLEAEDIGEG